MDEATLQIITEKVTVISKQTAESLKIFTKETALMMYAKQMIENNINTNIAEGTTQKKQDNTEPSKMEKMLEEGQLKWKYADDSLKKKVAQMEKVVVDGQAKIKEVYAVEVAKIIQRNA